MSPTECRLLFFSKRFCSKQRAQIRLLWEQSDLGPHCLSVVLDVSIYMQQTTSADGIFIFFFFAAGEGLIFYHQKKIDHKLLSAEVNCCIVLLHT